MTDDPSTQLEETLGRELQSGDTPVTDALAGQHNADVVQPLAEARQNSSEWLDGLHLQKAHTVDQIKSLVSHLGDLDAEIHRVQSARNKVAGELVG